MECADKKEWFIPHTNLNVCKVEWLCDGEIDTSFCLIEGASFSDAANNLVRDYGNDNIISMEIFPLETHSVPISESLYNAFKEADMVDVTACDHSNGCTKFY